MKAMQVQYDKDEDKIEISSDGTRENWIDVCERFDNDVHRLRDAEEHTAYSALYACYDEDNKPTYFLVEEDRYLDKIRRKQFLKKLGRAD